jgi:hypothetical protein
MKPENVKDYEYKGVLGLEEEQFVGALIEEKPNTAKQDYCENDAQDFYRAYAKHILTDGERSS